jgi:hypothetical protein
MYHLPTDSPKEKHKGQIVFFEDESSILKMIKNEDTTNLLKYFKTHGHENKLMSRFLGYSINMVKPFSFKTMCLMDMTIIPPDTMKRIFHVILCEHQDNVSEEKMEYLTLAARQIADFLIEYNSLLPDDVANSEEIFNEYDMGTFAPGLSPLIEVMKDHVAKL